MVKTFHPWQVWESTHRRDVTIVNVGQVSAFMYRGGCFILPSCVMLVYGTLGVKQVQ
jgi:hypothetical protein